MQMKEQKNENFEEKEENKTKLNFNFSSYERKKIKTFQKIS